MGKLDGKKIVIVGAGPAGLAAGFRLVEKTEAEVIIVEQTDMIGGLSRTVEFEGQRMDIGSHRFFTKSERVLNFWRQFLPFEGLDNVSAASNDYVLRKSRLSRILFGRRLFKYPLKIGLKILFKFGFFKIIKIIFSYLRVRLFPIKKVKNLEQFFINRFGKALYQIFFKDYTKKVWGVACQQIPPDWGEQRIKGMSLKKTFFNLVSKLTGNNNKEVSLTDYFYYPVLGSGYIYEKIAEQFCQKGGQILFNCRVVGVEKNNKEITKVFVNKNKKIEEINANILVSSMPIKELIGGLNDVPKKIQTIANNLIYRDLIVVALVLNREDCDLPDHWIYIQDKELTMGRIGFYHNFSSKMTANDDQVIMGLEFFCNIGDTLWSKTDQELQKLALTELKKIELLKTNNLITAKVIRERKAYPSYIGVYRKFYKIKKYLDSFTNLYLIGRNGMHRYNNMDHSVLSGLVAADNIIQNRKVKKNIWQVNTEKEYHEK